MVSSGALPRVAILGIGLMGRPMAERLIAAGALTMLAPIVATTVRIFSNEFPLRSLRQPELLEWPDTMGASPDTQRS